MYRAAVLGDYDSICGFAAAGIRVFPVEEEQAASALLEQLCREEYGVIFMTEALGAKLSGQLEELRKRMLPAVVLIPGLSGNTGKGMEGLRQLWRQAVGAEPADEMEKG